MLPLTDIFNALLAHKGIQVFGTRRGQTGENSSSDHPRVIHMTKET